MGKQGRVKMNTCFLRGNKIYLRGLEINDIEGNYISWLNDEDVCKYNSHHVFPYSKNNAEEYIISTFNSRNTLVLAIVLLENDCHIGNISLQNIDYINRSAEFAIIIGDKSCWGNGYSREAAYLIINHGFTELNLHRIYCGTSSDNIPMQRLACSLGMTEEGRRRQAMFKHNKNVDIIEYGLLKYEFCNGNI
jgi:RimJ/RimL family protein N-acetyltransferase